MPSFFNLKTDDDFMYHPIDKFAVSDGRRLAYLLYQQWNSFKFLGICEDCGHFTDNCTCERN